MVTRNILLAIGCLALIFGVVLSIVWFRQSSNTDAQTTARVLPAQAVLAAAKPIPVGTLLRLEDMTWIDIPGAEVVAGNIVRGSASETNFVGSVTLRSFRERDPLAANAFVKPGDRDFLIAALAPGYRAISIAVDAAQSVAGLMLPGDRVDVVLTQTFNLPVTAPGGGDPAHRSVAETVLHDLRIIAVDQKLNPNPNTTEPLLAAAGRTEVVLPKTITLEVTEKQAEMLLVADQLGKIQLTLRGRLPTEGGSVPPEHVPPAWASDVSPALGNLGTTAPAAGNGQGAIEVFHGPKIERRCLTGNGLVVCP
jgi:pilus assembly protein CpaB